MFLGILFTVVLVVVNRRIAAAREEARRMWCRGNLNQVAKSMATYLNEHGDNRFYPFPMGQGTRPGDFNGAEWIAALYWSGVMPDPGVYICPGSPDTNRNGVDIGTARAAPTFGSQTISYAGMHYRSGSVDWLPRPDRQPTGRKVSGVWRMPPGTGPYVLTNAAGEIAPGALRDDFPPNMPMASDDTQGPIHHRELMSVLFFDSHVEYKLGSEIDLRNGVGKPGGLLWQLRN